MHSRILSDSIRSYDHDWIPVHEAASFDFSSKLWQPVNVYLHRLFANSQIKT